MSKILLTSYIPPGFPNWPETGPVDWESVTAGMPDPKSLKVYLLPCQVKEPIFWQSHAHWVVLEVSSDDYEEGGGCIRFRRGQVLFNGPPQEARAYLRER